ncbi:hypothetical protein [Porphyrobacter sp. YT40]|uniref:hypothetical protein n=1 Tax=Porphyrobacter sp. YT40 TaxID=2547601 RepID=UPI00114501EB|nr:hypothetical protein [Porphyrobacter sp. YT40]QDH34192.1 hypothetical protein E2E27_07565 [Porphyrobacter sp. YT40]
MTITDVPLDKLREAFDLVLAQWPAEITPGEKTFHLGGSCNMRELNRVHQAVEDWSISADFDGLLDEIIGPAEHYVHTCIHSALQNLTVLRVQDLDFEAFCSRFDGHPNFRVIRS